MQKGIKFRIYPNREQKNFIHQTWDVAGSSTTGDLPCVRGYENGERSAIPSSRHAD